MLRRFFLVPVAAPTLFCGVRACASPSVDADPRIAVVTPAPQSTVAPAPHRTVGGVFLVHCFDHPFRHQWEVVKMLRDLRLEFRGQVAIHPDVPEVRKALWRSRHVVRIERLDLDEAKALIGVPKHMTFTDLAAQIPRTFGRTRATANPILRSKMNFMQYRKMRIRDILHRDAMEKRLLAAKKRVAASSQNAADAQP